ncbi:MAG: hypothetical protein PWP23_2863 [Candidatus Sumerlaeota bacterium]|nr:hypothetical protein [Candidatus Sumerlaeota bacterium]
MNAYNLADTYFVSRLGTGPLAAITFCFPVMMALRCIIRGLAAGAMTVVAHAIGRHDKGNAASLTTHALVLGTVTMVVLAVAGFMTVPELLGMLGANEVTLPLAGAYIRIMYMGLVFMTVSMMAGSIMIASGHVKMASFCIVLGTILNLVLDPIMIFGWLGFPALGIAGAALATIISEGIASAVALTILWRHFGLISIQIPSLSEMLAFWRSILRVAIPATLSLILMPISTGIITRIVVQFGQSAVAAVGVASRIEMFAFVIPMSIGMTLTPFVAQNFGAGRFDRIREARKITMWFAFLYGLAVASLFFIFSNPIARIFTEDPPVQSILVTCIRIIAFGFGLMEVHRYATFFLTGLDGPVSAALLNGVRVILLLVPLTLLGAWTLGLSGVFIARLLTDLTAGGLGIALTGKRGLRLLNLGMSPLTKTPQELTA